MAQVVTKTLRQSAWRNVGVRHYRGIVKGLHDLPDVPDSLLHTRQELSSKEMMRDYLMYKVGGTIEEKEGGSL